MTIAYERELTVALDAARLAAGACRSVQSRIPQFIEKHDASPVTVADFASQAIICQAIASAFPNDSIIGEEDSSVLRHADNAQALCEVQHELERLGLDATGRQICDWIDLGQGQESTARFWTLDPIDGTKGFLRSDQYAIALALIEDAEIQVAVLCCPNLPIRDDAHAAGAMFHAVRGSGSHATTLDAKAAPARIQVSRCDATGSARLCESVESGHTSHNRSAEIAERLGITRSSRRLDSQAKYAVVARGEADIYLRLPTRADYREKIWDHAAGVLIVEEAGGQVTDVLGRPLDFCHGRELLQNRGVVATNGRLHGVVLDAVRASGVA